jgi:pimeloyl-ACP methyl ester carboxylesterase
MTASTSVDLHPFTIDIRPDQRADLHTRLANTRWPDQLPGPDWQRGVPVAYLRSLADYWQADFDWHAQQDRINAYPQFLTDIDGQQLHFLHVRSARADATPLLLVHGWPGSFIEFLDLIGPLSSPASDQEPAFHLVIPSLPGFGFSSPLSGEGWTSTRIARAFARLMASLGYARYGAQGGDYGAFVAPDLGRVDPEHVIGVHVNAATFGFIPFGPVSDEDRASLTDVERARVDRLGHFLTELNGYFQIQATRPQTLAYGLTDSPAGQLAWIVEKFAEWTDVAHPLPEQAVDRDAMLADVSLYWFTRTAGSAANLYYESMHNQAWPTPSTVPTGVAVFGQDVAIRRYAEGVNRIVHWSDFPNGGHFAAMETPELLVADIRAFFGGLSG